MASETVDPIDWSHPPPSWAVPPERVVHSINRCSSATAGILTCNVATFSMRGNHLAYAATQGMSLSLVTLVIVATSVLLRCYSAYTYVLPIIESCSPVWGSAAECYLQLLKRKVYSVSRLCSDQTFLSLCHRRHVAELCMLYNANSNSNHCLFSELPSASVRVRYIELRLQLIHYSYKYQGAERLNFQGVSRRPRLVCAWNGIPYTVIDTGTLDGFKGAADRWLLP